jgi:hypothetical protein
MALKGVRAGQRACYAGRSRGGLEFEQVHETPAVPFPPEPRRSFGYCAMGDFNMLAQSTGGAFIFTVKNAGGEIVASGENISSLGWAEHLGLKAITALHLGVPVL